MFLVKAHPWSGLAKFIVHEQFLISKLYIFHCAFNKHTDVTGRCCGLEMFVCLCVRVFVCGVCLLCLCVDASVCVCVFVWGLLRLCVCVLVLIRNLRPLFRPSKIFVLS